ncbi:zinc finger MYM-type protein 1-like [Diabrotica undecimpunctata]|uniref:zinc finger MYM-type protein 1-like n=1 Tax=Diabrotica undecimpunctata TaxID=50387 RepID=UPI003B637ECA
MACQGMAFRGHDESESSLNKGNFKEICGLIAKSNKDFDILHNSNKIYTSTQIQNEIIALFSRASLRNILDDIRQFETFSIMCDEARSFKNEQLSLCVWYASQDLEIRERFFAFINCSENRLATNLFTLIYKKLEELNPSDLQMVGQSYGGAVMMSGNTSGL